MLQRSLPVRVLLVACLLFAVWGLERIQKPAALADAQATWPVGAAGLSSQKMQAVARGTIPMPEGVAAAHASNLLAMPAGHDAVLTAFWFAGDRESAPNVQIAASQFDRRTQAWRPARFVVNRHIMGEQLGFGLRRLGNPVAWLDGSGRMHLFVVATGWGGWAAGRVLHLVQDSASNDLAALSFVADRVLPLTWLWNTSFLVRNNPLQLSDGGMELPVHFEIGIKYPAAVRFDAQGRFSGMERISRQSHWLQPTLVMQSPQRWLAFMRDTRAQGFVGAAQTLDGGKSWQDLPDLALVNPDAAVSGLGLAEGQMVLVHNSSAHSRALLDLSASANGVEWTRVAALAHGGDADEYSYPGMAWADGALWVSYTDHRKHIAWQRLSPARPPGAAP